MVLRSVCRTLNAAALCLIAAAAGAQSTSLSIEEIYGYEGWKRLNGSQSATMSWVPAGDPWLSDTHHLWPATMGAEASGLAPSGPWLRVDATSGTNQVLYTYAELERALVEAGASPAEAQIASRRVPSNFNSARDAFMVTIA